MIGKYSHVCMDTLMCVCAMNTLHTCVHVCNLIEIQTFHFPPVFSLYPAKNSTEWEIEWNLIRGIAQFSENREFCSKLSIKIGSCFKSVYHCRCPKVGILIFFNIRLLREKKFSPCLLFPNDWYAKPQSLSQWLDWTIVTWFFIA